MSGKVGSHIWGTFIANFDGISVNKFAKGGTFWEVLVYKTEKLFANPCLYIHAKGEVKPNYLPF